MSLIAHHYWSSFGVNTAYWYGSLPSIGVSRPHLRGLWYWGPIQLLVYHNVHLWSSPHNQHLLHHFSMNALITSTILSCNLDGIH
jgi:hypothetical protein